MNIVQDLDGKQVLQVLSIAFSDSSELEINDPNLAQGTSGGSKEGSGLSGTETASAKVSIGEFMADLQISSNTICIAAVALYLREQLNKPQITKDEVPDWFKRAGEAAPKNLARDLSNAVRRKLIAEDPNNPGNYYVTATGVKTLRNSK